MLYLIGLGLWDENDISIEGIETCRKSDEVYAEFYTAKWGGDIKALEKMIGKRIFILERKDLEDSSREFVSKAKDKDISLLVPGDPLTATTHINLITEARDLGVDTKIIHSSSIYTAVAECGLSIYNLGRTATVVRPQEGYKPESFYDVIKMNNKLGLHTLLLLDIDMKPQEGLNILMDIEKKRRKNILSQTKIVVASRLGSSEQKIKYGKISELIKEKFDCPGVILVPGNLQFFEKEFLERL